MRETAIRLTATIAREKNMRCCCACKQVCGCAPTQTPREPWSERSKARTRGENSNLHQQPDCSLSLRVGLFKQPGRAGRLLPKGTGSVSSHPTKIPRVSRMCPPRAKAASRTGYGILSHEHLRGYGRGCIGLWRGYVPSPIHFLASPHTLVLGLASRKHHGVDNSAKPHRENTKPRLFCRLQQGG